MVPLAEAWRSGAATWTAEQRKAFGNDLKDPQLLIASESSNTSKSDSWPAGWKSTNHAFWCVYAADYTPIKSVWKLTTADGEGGAVLHARHLHQLTRAARAVWPYEMRRLYGCSTLGGCLYRFQFLRSVPGGSFPEEKGTRMQTVCLNMIVKNEAHVIRRCLESVRPLIDTWAILDTGSTDGPQGIIRETYADLPGTLHESQWKGFDASRTEAIELGRGCADYLLFIDADDVMEADLGFKMPTLMHDAYDFEVRHGNIVHWRPTMVSTRLPWRYQGVLHEFLNCDTTFSRAALTGVRMIIIGGGGRLASTQREKYLRDAAILEEGLRHDPDNTRYVFYLAQSWRDADEPAKALAAYDRRATMGGFAEEAFIARLYAARLALQLKQPTSEVVARLLDAHEYRPTRAEPLGELAVLCRTNGERWPLAYMFAKRAVDIHRPNDLLFVEQAGTTGERWTNWL